MYVEFVDSRSMHNLHIHTLTRSFDSMDAISEDVEDEGELKKILVEEGQLDPDQEPFGTED